MQQTTTAQPGQLSHDAICSVIKQAFGQTVDDVLLPAQASSEVFGWVESIMMSIGSESRKKHPNYALIDGLAKSGAFVASFHVDSFYSQFEQMADSLAAVGIDVRGEGLNVACPPLLNVDNPDESKLVNIFKRLDALRESGAIVINKDAGSLEQDDANGFLDWVGQQVKGGAQ